MPTRAEMWSRLDEPVDLLVIGGGATGCGIARDAAMRGLRVALVEARDFAFGTSSRSSKLVHGGLRYLEQMEVRLVWEAVSERRILSDIAPHLVQPLGFLFPVFEGSRQPLWLINTGLIVYEGLSLLRSPRPHKRMGPEDVARVEPLLKQDGLQGAPLYYDCATDDARLTLENALDAVAHGAVVVNACKVTGFRRNRVGRICGVEVEDQVSGEIRSLEAGAVINATGPWTDRTLALGSEEEPAPLLRPTKGVHLVVDRERLPVQHAVVCMHPEDGRVLFAIPWGDQAYLGTTDTDFEGDPADVATTAEDVRYLLDAANAYFPGVDLVPEDVRSTWAGLRPLIAPPSADGLSESSVSREHEIVVGADGLITIAGGKLTTYRSMAAEVVDQAVKLLRLTGRNPATLQAAHTDREPLPGAVGWPEDDDASRLVARVRSASGDRLDVRTAQALVGAYGTRAVDVAVRVQADPTLATRLVPDRPDILAQVDHAVDEEMAASVSDVLVRRTQLYFRAKDQGVSAADVVAQRMAVRLGWTEERASASAQDFLDEVARSRRWRQEMADASREDAAAS